MGPKLLGGEGELFGLPRGGRQEVTADPLGERRDRSLKFFLAGACWGVRSHVVRRFVLHTSQL